ncbi:uncharacterized protein LOC119658713 isoform X3 [Hermetia illucens]|uniref:uncharacterized protein LOC119658713 isoform X3 n=1 Tax=Hermetia illucens TaxID=343691 RepID=UPI0018CC6F8C|nr:uncharacterized protein LOC119658713 isoform X3 [Hermetia illucens]
MTCSNVEESHNKPPWLTKPYVADALEIVKLEIIRASSKGDNYCGAMTKFKCSLQVMNAK